MRKQLFFIFPLAILALLFTLWAGLIRLGWSLPVSKGVADHGALMVGSFLGTVIMLERAVALKKQWGYALPLLNALSFPCFLLGYPQLAYTCLIAGSLSLMLIFWLLIQRHAEDTLWLMLCGAGCWLIGNFLLLQHALYPMAVFWWMLFLLVTIAAERLELTRFLPINRKQKALLYLALAICLLGVLLPYHGWGRWVLGTGMLGCAAWLLRFDLARKSAKKSLLTAFSGKALLLGYGWLLLSGLLLFSYDSLPLMYDAVLHAFFLGFVFSMIFAHGPIIFPAVLGIHGKPYHSLLYLPLVLLHASLLLRVSADIFLWYFLRSWSGIFSSLAILLYFGLIIVLLLRTKKGVHAPFA